MKILAAMGQYSLYMLIKYRPILLVVGGRSRQGGVVEEGGGAGRNTYSIRVPKVRTPCPKFGHFPVRLKSEFLPMKNKSAINVNKLSILCQNKLKFFSAFEW